MIFSKKKITIAYTVEQCTKCGSMSKRKFQKGDVLFADTSKCASCNEAVCIEKIFGQTTEQ